MGLGQNIAQYRKKAKPKLTQKDLARRVGIHKSYLSAIEKGHAKPSYKLVAQIAECLEVQVNTLLGGK